MKTCRKCRIEKTEGEFYTLPRFICKVCHCASRQKWKLLNKVAYQKQQREYQQKRRDDNPELQRLANQKWLAAHPGAMRVARKKYREKYPGRDNARTRAWKKATDYEKNKYRTDPQHKIKILLRGRLGMALKAGGVKKAASTLALLGCSLKHLKAHLESLFKPGMAWENHGPIWHIDHIKPCAKFDLTDPEQQKICFHWTNLQPLFALENLQKAAS